MPGRMGGRRKKRSVAESQQVNNTGVGSDVMVHLTNPPLASASIPYEHRFMSGLPHFPSTSKNLKTNKKERYKASGKILGEQVEGF